MSTNRWTDRWTDLPDLRVDYIGPCGVVTGRVRLAIGERGFYLEVAPGAVRQVAGADKDPVVIELEPAVAALLAGYIVATVAQLK